MFSTLTSILIAIFVLGMIIFFHELGHFLTAKAAGLTVHEFAIGMGPVIVSVFHKGTKYSLRLLPIGGLARLAGEEPDDQNEQVPIHGRFDKRSVATRMGVIVAGPIMNFVLASLIFVFLFVFIGVPTNKPIIGTVSEGGAAQMAGLMANDQLLRIDQIQIAAWTDIQRAIADKADQEVSILLQRGGQLITIVAVPRFSAENNRALIGITPRIEKYSVLQSIANGLKETYWFTSQIVVMIFSMVTGKIPAEGAGPVGIVMMVGEVAKTGITNLLSFAAIFSIQIGLFNLLPIPALDGSKLVFLAIEWLRGKPLNPEKENLVHMVGFAFIITMLILVTVKDVQRLF